MKLGFSNIKKNFLANLFGISVLLLNQVILVPVYLHFWDTKVYSDWIVLTAISSFFSVSDIGLNSVTINQFVIMKEEGRLEECKALLVNNYLLVLFSFLISIGGTIVFIFYFDIVTVFGLHSIPPDTANFVFLMLLGYIFLGMASSVDDAVYRAFYLNHKSVYIGNLVRLGEGLIILTSLVFKLSLSNLVVLYLLPRFIAFVYKKIDIKKYFRYKLSIRNKNWTLFKAVLFPSITFMAFPIGNAIVYQGFSLLVNRHFGSSLLILFNTTRTLTNFLNQLLGTILQAVWPEFSSAYGRKDIDRMRELHRMAFATAIFGAVFISMLLLFVGPLIFDVWTVGELTFDYSLMLSFLIVLVFRSAWSTSSVTLMATNKHSTIGIGYAFLSLISLAIAYISISVFPSLILLVYCLLIIEVSLSIYALKQGLLITKDTLPSLVRSIGSTFKFFKSHLINLIPKFN